MLRQKTYSLSDIESLTGITAHSLRIWERRYNFIKANRSETNIRYYTEDQLRQLLNISFLKKNGLKVSMLNKMTEKDIENMVLKVSALSDNNEAENTINELIKLMLTFDESQIQSIFNHNIKSQGFQTFMTSVVFPFFRKIGFLWSANKLAPAHEHFITNLIRNRIIVETNKLPTTQSNHKIVLFLPEEEHHEIGLLFSAYLARKEGWRVLYFGQNLPIISLIAALEETQASIALGFYTLSNPIKSKEHINQLTKSINIKLVVAGNAANFEGIPSEVSIMSSPESLIEILHTKKPG